ncbi:Copper-responsive transcriptional regulator [Granulibacter bethesdensis]|uniref:Cu(I)-responsive transcriptional regulator n=1 Tax=Granulibacter bethesdensis TaxID=364410 RepID=UPI000909F4E2|nr:Cu(I)-responsive transcriptional regulator [Granulibacter bethesdensis]APH57919.1 Copper-responsive transcriptional regulator [Granulibacter bethesdensis]
MPDAPEPDHTHDHRGGLAIGEVSRLSGLPAKTIRYYEQAGLLPPPSRSDNQYRRYHHEVLERLRFLSAARGLGFPLQELKMLMALRSDPHRASREVKSLALEHIDRLEDDIARLQTMRDTLQGLTAACPGDDCPACTILDALNSAGIHTQNGASTNAPAPFCQTEPESRNNQ